jgi:Predicted membrane protein (DUF2142)
VEEGGQGRQARQAGPSALNASAARLRWLALAWFVAFAWALTWALGTGRYGGPDEPAHVIRAAAVAEGELRGGMPTTSSRLRGGFRTVTVPTELTTGDPSCYRHDGRIPAACAAGRPASGHATVATAAGANPPWYYLVVGVPVRLAGASASALAHRIAAVAWLALVLALAALRLRGFSRRSIALVLVTVSPAAWFLSGVVNPNSLEIALTLLAWISAATLIRHDQVSARDAAWVGIPLAVAVLVRPLAVMAAVAVVAVVVVASRGTRRWSWLARAWLAAPVLVAGFATVVWNSAVGFAFDDPRTASSLQGWAVVRHALGDVPTTLRELAGSWSWLEVRVPWPVALAWSIAAGGVVVTCWLRARAPVRLAMVAWAVVLVLAPVAFEVTQAHRVGFIWQGRYSIPTACALACFALLADRSPEPEAGLPPASSHRVSSGADRWRPGAVVGALVLAEVAVFWWSVRRATVGVDGSWGLTSGPHGVWRPEVDARLVLVVHAVLVAGLAIWGTSPDVDQVV